MQSDLHKQLLELEARLKIHKLHENMLLSRIADVRGKFQAECEHTETEVTSNYVSGTYNDRAYTIHTVTCATCKKVLDTNTVTHSYYG